MSLRTEFVRLTIKEGAKNRFLISLALEPPPTKTELGQLFVLIEITKKWFFTTQIGQSIVGILSRTYYRADSTSDLQNFEYAIAQVNRFLGSLIDQDETEWIGHLHSTVLLTNHEAVHIATTGAMPVWLLRDDHFTIITEPLDPATTLPTKVFGAITSGTLANQDILFVGSSEIYEEIPKNDLKSWLQGKLLYEAGVVIAKELKKRKLQETVALLISATTAEKSSNSHAPTVIYLDQPVEPIATQLKRVFVLIKEKIHQIFGISIQSIQKIIRFIKRSRLSIRPQASSQPPTIVTADTHQSEDQSTLAKQPLIGRSIFNIHDYRNRARFSRRFGLGQISLLATLTWLNRHTPQLRLATSSVTSQSFMPLLGALLLGAFLITSVAWQKNQLSHRKARRENEQLLAEAKKRIEDGKNALIFNNRREAQSAFAAAIEQAEQLVKQESFSERAKEVITQAQHDLDGLVGTTRLRDLTPIVSVDSLLWAAVYDGRLLTMQKNQPKINEQNPIDPQPTQLASLSNISQPIRPLFSDNLLYIVTPATIEQINLVSRQITVFTETPQLELTSVIDLQRFGNSLYALAPTDNKIAKIPFEKESFGAITNYLKKGDIKNAVSMAIDGAVYVLGHDGQVTKFSRGEKQEFTLGDLPKPNHTIKKPLQIDTSESIATLFVVDANPDEPRIIEFDKNGKYLHQFVLPTDKGELTSVFYQLKARKAWVVLGSGVYEVNL